jgi:hypothetical protein
MMDDWREESLAEDISPVGVAAVVLFILGLVCLTIELGAPAIERPMSAPTSTEQ